MRVSLKLCQLLLLAQAVAAGGCRSRELRAAEGTHEERLPPPEAWTDTSPHLSEDAELKDLRVNYLDWGGSGPPLVLVHGFGDNPHIFDELGPRLRERFHVMAFARRGHGDSDAPPRGPYDVRALASDLRRFLDALRIDRANLLGWGVAANEITRFATLAPERVDKLIYLEGGYDWSDAKFLAALGRLLASTVPATSDTRSLDAYRAWYEDMWLGHAAWTPGMEAYLRGAIRIGNDGRVVPRMSRDTARRLFEGLQGAPRDYERVDAPVLALYAATFFPTDQSDPERARLTRQFENEVASPFRSTSMDRVQRELRNVTVRQLAGTTHVSIGVRDVEGLATTITNFLLPTEEPADAASE
jgi:pimeloyl-ACP methyl ester carboxylesterase